MDFQSAFCSLPHGSQKKDETNSVIYGAKANRRNYI